MLQHILPCLPMHDKVPEICLDIVDQRKLPKKTHFGMIVMKEALHVLFDPFISLLLTFTIFFFLFLFLFDMDGS